MSLRLVIVTALVSAACSASPARAPAPMDPELARARNLLAEVERSPSAYLPDLRAKLHEARTAAAAALEREPEHGEARALLARIDTLLTQLAPRGRPAHPMEAEAAATLERLEALVKGGGSRREVEAVHTRLRRSVVRLQRDTAAAATLYESRAQFLWDSYASRLAKVDDVCPGCPRLDLAALAGAFDSPRLLGAGDYSLEALDAMAEDVAAAKPRFTPLLTGDFDGDGSIDVALVGRGRRNDADTLFMLVAAREGERYRAVFLQPLDWKTAALAVKDGAVVLSMVFAPTDDFWWVRWNGACCVLRHAADDMRGRPLQGGGR
jgi:hypothetical protein